MTWQFTNRELRAFYLGILDPWREAALRQAMADDPELRARCAAFAPKSDPPAIPPTPAWRIPPPGVVGRVPMALRAERVLQMSAAVSPVLVTIGPVDDAGDRRLVLLQHLRTRWEVRSPTCPEEDRRLLDIPADEHGNRTLILNVPSDEPSRWAVVLAPLEPVWDQRPEDRWTAIQEGVDQGRIPVRSFEIEASTATKRSGTK